MSKPEVGTRIEAIRTSGMYWTPEEGRRGTVVPTDFLAIGNEFQVQWDGITDDTHYYLPSDEEIVWRLAGQKKEEENA